MRKGDRVLVTGGAGFIGSHLVDALLGRGNRVRVLDDFSTGLRDNLAHVLDQIELIEGDIRNQEACRRACHEVRFVFHQAALGSVPRSLERPEETYSVNLVGTVSLLKAAVDAGVDRFIYASSSSVYGDSDRLPKRVGEEGQSLSPYAASKLGCEHAAQTFGRAYGLETIGLRYFNVYGPRQRPDGPYAAVVPKFLTACLTGDAPIIYGDGEQSRDFTFVSDAVAANLRAAEAGQGAVDKAYNIARGERVTINELADVVIRAIRAETSAQHEPPRPGDVRHSLADLSTSREDLGFSPSVDLHEGIEACVGHRLASERTAEGAADD